MKQYLAWVGGGATYGKPNQYTGRYDSHGELYSFNTKKERDLFCEQYNNRFNCYPVQTNKRQAKALYFAGHTQQQFETHLKYIELEQGV